MIRTLIAALAVLSAGCADSTTYLRNPTTGAEVTCGGTHPLTLAENAVQRREAKCIDDYKDQGFVRVPSGK